MKTKTLDFCIGWGVRIWLTLILLFVAVIPRACAEDIPTDHINHAGCRVAANKEYTAYGLYYDVTYPRGIFTAKRPSPRTFNSKMRIE